MTPSNPKVYIYGRLPGLTLRRLGQMAAAAGLKLTRRASAADAIVLAHSTAGFAVSDAGELRPGFRRKAEASLMSEGAFRAKVGLEVAPAASESHYSEDQIARHARLNVTQVRTLSHYDVISPVDTRFPYTDLVAARAVGRLFAAGAKFPKILVAALALKRQGASSRRRQARRSAVGRAPAGVRRGIG